MAGQPLSALLAVTILAVWFDAGIASKDPLRVHDSTSVFRVGSGAPVGAPTPEPVAERDHRPALERLAAHGLPTPALSFILLALIVMMMMMPNLTNGGHNTGGRSDVNYVIPPTWSPEMEATYSFRAYMTDIALWIMLTDLQPH